MNQPDIDTLYRIVWDLTPTEFTHSSQLGLSFTMRLGYQTKLAGWNWRSYKQLGKLLYCAVKRGVLEVQGDGYMRRGKHPRHLKREATDAEERKPVLPV